MGNNSNIKNQAAFSYSKKQDKLLVAKFNAKCGYERWRVGTDPEDKRGMDIVDTKTNHGYDTKYTNIWSNPYIEIYEVVDPNYMAYAVMYFRGNKCYIFPKDALRDWRIANSHLWADYGTVMRANGLVPKTMIKGPDADYEKLIGLVPGSRVTVI